MNRTVHVSASMILASALWGAKAHQWETGKVLDTQAAKTYFPSDSIRPGSITETQLYIAATQFTYVVSISKRDTGGMPLGSAMISKATNHPCRFIVGDEVKFWQDKSTLHVVDADNRECKAEVMRQKRLKAEK